MNYLFILSFLLVFSCAKAQERVNIHLGMGISGLPFSFSPRLAVNYKSSSIYSKYDLKFLLPNSFGFGINQDLIKISSGKNQVFKLFVDVQYTYQNKDRIYNSDDINNTEWELSIEQMQYLTPMLGLKHILKNEKEEVKKFLNPVSFSFYTGYVFSLTSNKIDVTKPPVPQKSIERITKYNGNHLFCGILLTLKLGRK